MTPTFVGTSTTTGLMNEVLDRKIPEFKQYIHVFVEDNQLYRWRETTPYTGDLDKIYVRDLTPKEKMVFDCYKDMVRVLREE